MARWVRVFGLASAVGVLSGAASAALAFGLHEGAKLLIGRFTHLGQAHVLAFRWEILALPTAGGLLAGLLVYWLCPRLKGHGTELLIRAFHREGGVLPLRGPAVNAGAAVVVISCGGSAGPEGPIAALGAAIGSTFARALSLTPRERRILLLAGCGAGVGAIFQCPLGGALFATTVLYREPDIETDAIVPAFIASVLGYSTYMMFWGSGQHLLQGANTLAFTSPLELIPYAVLGPLCGLVSILLRASLRTVEELFFVRFKVPRWIAPALGGFATGLVALLLPQVMDGQYVFIQNALDGNLLAGMESRPWWWWSGLFGAVVLAKCIATGLTVGSGAPGGLLGPNVFIGGVVGAFVGALVFATAPNLFTDNPENLRRALIPVGMAGVLAASMRVPLASLVMVTEMTGSYGLIVPLMVVCISSYVVGRRWGLSDEQVRSAPESPAHAGDFVVHMLELSRVGEVMQRDELSEVPPGMSLGELIRRLEPGRSPAFAVIEDGRIGGLVSAAEIRQIMDVPGISDAVIAADIMNADFTTLTPDEDLYQALSSLARSGQIVAPVVSAQDSSRYVGMLRRGDIHRAVRARLDEMRAHLLSEHAGFTAMEQEDSLYQIVTGATGADTTDRIQRLLVPLQAVGKSLREADFRRQFGVQVVAIEQPDGTILCPPDPDTPLQTNQRLLVIASTQAAEDSVKRRND
jgi:CIC family chloride channel protein